MAVAAGTRLGPYEISGLIGAGGMGEVWRARDARLGREVAIKLLPASLCSDSQRLHRFEQEAKAAAALNHPNILAVYDLGTQDGVPFIVSELLEGETLREKLRSESLPLRKAVEYAIQIARGLGAAHDKGIVHRDLKPENIFITNDGRVKILDFGLAKLIHPGANGNGQGLIPTVVSEPGAMLGTVGYMSPEQARGREADHRSDIFALGAVLYEMVSGKPAFHRETAADTLSAILKEDPPELAASNSRVSPALDRVVRHCLEKNSNERFQSARDIAFDLELLSDSSTSISLPTAPPPSHRRRWMAASAALLLLVSSCAVAFLLGHRNTSPRAPVFHRLTFRRGSIRAARFAPDGQTVVYGAAWDGTPVQLFTTRYDSSDSRSMGLQSGQILSISSNNELAILLHPETFEPFRQRGNLAQVSLAGGGPRELLENIECADWTPDGGLAIVRRADDASTSSLNLLELPPGKVIYRPRAWISHLRVSRNGQFLAFADHVLGGDDGEVIIVDRSGKVQTSSQRYSSVQGVAWSADGREVWFTAAPIGTERALYAMSLSGKTRLVLRVPSTLTVHDISGDGRVLLGKDDIRIGLAARAPGEKAERDLSWFDWSLLGDLSKDGKTVIFSETGEAVGSKYGIYMRNTDGSPAVRLGEGAFAALSPDGKWVVTNDLRSPSQLQLLPTGVGEPRVLTHDNIEHLFPAWYPDGKHILFVGLEAGHGRRSYIYDVAAGTTRALTPEGTIGSILAPDGSKMLTTTNGRSYSIAALDGGATPIPVKAISADDQPVQWDTDNRHLFVANREIPMTLFRLAPDTGQRQLWKQITGLDPAGLESMPCGRLGADGSYAYSYYRVLSELYVVEGLK
jgi:serine/threonine protein kinase